MSNFVIKNGVLEKYEGMAARSISRTTRSCCSTSDRRRSSGRWRSCSSNNGFCMNARNGLWEMETFELESFT